MIKKRKKAGNSGKVRGKKVGAKKKAAKKKVIARTKPRTPAKPRVINYSAEKHPEAARVAASEGYFSQRGLADKLRVPKSSIGRWMKGHKLFADAVAEGKKENVEQIEESFHQLAAGGLKRTKIKSELVSEGRGQAKKTAMKVTEKITEIAFPHAGACQKILAAHKPKLYKDKSVGEDIADGLSKLLGQIDGSGTRLPDEN